MKFTIIVFATAILHRLLVAALMLLAYGAAMSAFNGSSSSGLTKPLWVAAAILDFPIFPLDYLFHSPDAMSFSLFTPRAILSSLMIGLGVGALVRHRQKLKEGSASTHRKGG